MTDSPAPTAPPQAAPRAWLWAEFLLLFIGVPILLAIFFETIQRNRALFPIIISLSVLALAMLSATPGWKFRTLFCGPVLSEWRIILGFWIFTAVACLAFVLAINPDMLFSIVRYRPELWLVIMIFYPVLSAWPQEIIYRALFFERYECLFPTKALLIIVNGAVFGFGHLFYENWITISMTAVGGMIMGWAYLRHRSMTLSWILHAIAGQLVFTAGLGVYFYHGAVG